MSRMKMNAKNSTTLRVLKTTRDRFHDWNEQKLLGVSDDAALNVLLDKVEGKGFDKAGVQAT